MRLDPWRALGAAICLAAAAATCGLLVVAAWAIAPYVAEAVR